MRGWLALGAAALVVGRCDAGVKPTAFVSADVYHGGAHNDAVTFSFHLSEDPGGTASCTGSPKFTSEVGMMTGDKVLSEDASLITDFYAGWTIVTTGGTGGVLAASTITAYLIRSKPLLPAILESSDTETRWPEQIQPSHAGDHSRRALEQRDRRRRHDV